MANFVSLLPMHCAWEVKSLALDISSNPGWLKGILISWAYEIIRSINWVGFHLNKNTQIYNHSVIHVSFGFQTNSLQESPLQMPRNMKPRNPPFQLSGTSTPNRKRASSSPCSKRLWASACGVEQKGKTSLAPVKVRQKIVVSI